MLSSRGNSFKWLFPKAGWRLAECACPGQVPLLAGCDSRGCLVGLSPARYQNECPDTQTYGLSAETSPKSAVHIGNSWCWAQLRDGSQKRPTIGPKFSFSKPFLFPGISPHLLLKHVNSQSSNLAQSLSSGNPTWVGSTWKDKAIQNQLISKAVATAHLKWPIMSLFLTNNY